MKKSNLLTTAAAVMLLTATAATAQTCIKTPSCADLGYTKTAADCSGKTILKMPARQHSSLLSGLRGKLENIF